VDRFNPGRKAVRVKIAALLVCVTASCAMAQEFSVLPADPPAPADWSIPGPRPVNGATLRIDPAALAAVLAAAPAHRLDARLADYGLLIDLPHPSGAMVPCHIAESPVMDPALQARFPQIRAYLVQSVDGLASGRLEITPRGLTAMLRAVRPEHDAARPRAGDTWMIDPWQSGDPRHAVVYWLRDLAAVNDWTCHTAGEPLEADRLPMAAAADSEGSVVVRGQDSGGSNTPRGGLQLRTIRLAMACTGEWGLHQCTVQGNPPNLVDPLAAIVTVVSRTNVIYEADLAVHLSLVADNDQLVFIDPATDPYPDACDGTGGSDCSGPYLAANIEALNTIIGAEDFDLGHLLTRVYGGVAYLGAVCGDSKAGGISGIPRGGDVDPLAALVVIHEIGHQFGARHSYSGVRGRCQGNVTLNTAWEAGTGSSPMGYAGGCPVGDAPPSDNIVLFADPFFHHGSVREMTLLLGQRTCPQQTSTGNTLPIIESITPDTNIPPGTPFTLAAVAMDPDGDLLTFSWEQYDNGVARPITGDDAVDNGEGALFRIFPPVHSAARTFPQMSDVLAGTHTPGELLPTVTGVTRRFRVIVRDNFPGAGGAVYSGFTRLTLPPGTSPFAVTAPADSATVQPGAKTVEWTVGGTNVPPISCATVTITLSADDGVTFDQSLGTFPNTGSAAVALPELPDPSTIARIRIDADGQIFFAVSRPFTLIGQCRADFDGENGVEVSDIFAFLSAWFALDSAADIDGDNTIAVPDIFAFLSLWFAGC
jgi:hypothetical protein